jgi:L-ribulokinase
MTGLKNLVYRPAPAAAQVYDHLFRLYRELHDAFGTSHFSKNLGHVMKELLTLRDKAREA